MQESDFDAFIARHESRIFAMGFERNDEMTDEGYRQYRRGDFAIKIFTDRYEPNLFTILGYLLDKSDKKDRAMVAYTEWHLMKALDTPIWKRYLATSTSDYDGTLSIFLEFLEKYDHLICQYPLPEPLRTQYRENMKAAAIPGVNPDNDPSTMDRLPPYMKKIS